MHASARRSFLIGRRKRSKSQTGQARYPGYLFAVVPDYQSPRTNRYMYVDYRSAGYLTGRLPGDYDCCSVPSTCAGPGPEMTALVRSTRMSFSVSSCLPSIGLPGVYRKNVEGVSGCSNANTSIFVSRPEKNSVYVDTRVG